MNNASQFSLRWYNYVNHLSKAFNTLRFENDLVDVTICCDGGKIRAHKMLLSACSNYFKQIFKENPCQHPVIIFKNFKYEDLNAIINFIYHGEVNIVQEQLESFLIMAELLEIRGLTDNAEHESSKGQLNIVENTLLHKWKGFNSSRPTERPVPPSADELPVPPSADGLPVPLSAVELPITMILPTLPTNRDENIPKDNSLVSQESESEVSEPQPDMSNFDTTTIKTEKIENFNDEIQDDTESTSLAEELSNKKWDLRKFRFQLGPKGFKQPISFTLDNSLVSQEPGTEVSESQPDTSNFDTTMIKTEMQIDTQSTLAELSNNSNPGPKGFKHPTSLTLDNDSHAGKKHCPVSHRSFSLSSDMTSHLQRTQQRKQITVDRNKNIPQDNSLVSQESGTEVSESQPDTSNFDTTTIKTEITANINDEMQIDTQSTLAEELSDESNPESELTKFRRHVGPKCFKQPTSLTLHKESNASKKQCPVCHRSFSRAYDMRNHLKRVHQRKQVTINIHENFPQDNSLVSQESGTKVSESQPDTSNLDTTTIKTELSANINDEMQIYNQNTSAESTLDKDLQTGKKQCPVCHRIFSQKYDLKGHLRKIHQSKQLTIKEIIYKNNSDTMAKPKSFTHNISHIYIDTKPK